METQKDYRELLELFNAHEVEYVIVGGYALAFHGAPRFTGDLDLYVRADRHNAERALEALKAFGFSSANLTIEDFSSLGNVIQLGYAPVRVDIVTSISGVSWEEVREGRKEGRYGEVPVHYIGKEQFARNKRATGRLKDLADLEALGEIEPPKNENH